MKFSRSEKKTARRLSGFTLIELMVVIAIIGILAGLMFPVATSILRQAEESAAENTAYQLKNAIASYFTEYRKYPVAAGATGDTQLFTDHELMDVLLGADSEAESGGLNPRRITFFSGKAAKPAGNGLYRKGVKLETGGAGELFDPYTEYYRVIMDTDANSRVIAPSWAAGTTPELPLSVLVWSAGKDQDDETKADNLKTW